MEFDPQYMAINPRAYVGLGIDEAESLIKAFRAIDSDLGKECTYILVDMSE